MLRRQQQEGVMHHAFSSRALTRVLICTLFLGTFAFGQQQNQLQTAPFPAANALPATHAQANQPRRSLDTRTEANDQIRSNLQSSLEGDLLLRGANVAATVDDENITITGTVEGEAQHERVLELLSPYFNNRTVVDQVTVQ
jgi:BON domain